MEIKLQIPSLPSYLKIKGGKGRVDIGDLNENDYNKFESEYMKALRSHWIRRRELMNSKQ